MGAEIAFAALRAGTMVQIGNTVFVIVEMRLTDSCDVMRYLSGKTFALGLHTTTIELKLETSPSNTPEWTWPTEAPHRSPMGLTIQGQMFAVRAYSYMAPIFATEPMYLNIELFHAFESTKSQYTTPQGPLEIGNSNLEIGNGN